MGTARIAADPRQGACAPDGSLHGTAGLYVADASLFPTALGVNPMMTIIAFAKQVAREVAGARRAPAQHAGPTLTPRSRRGSNFGTKFRSSTCPSALRADAPAADHLVMKPFATKLLIVCGAVLGLAVFASTAAAAPAKSGHAKGSFLYVQETAGGSIERLGAGAYRLRLTGVSPRVTTFTDRPRRRAGRQGLTGFVGSWKANGFAADPPNAALVLDHAPASHDVALLTLSQPSLRPRPADLDLPGDAAARQ